MLIERMHVQLANIAAEPQPAPPLQFESLRRHVELPPSCRPDDQERVAFLNVFREACIGLDCRLQVLAWLQGANAKKVSAFQHLISRQHGGPVDAGLKEDRVHPRIGYANARCRNAQRRLNLIRTELRDRVDDRGIEKLVMAAFQPANTFRRMPIGMADMGDVMHEWNPRALDRGRRQVVRGMKQVHLPRF